MKRIPTAAVESKKQTINDRIKLLMVYLHFELEKKETKEEKGRKY